MLQLSLVLGTLVGSNLVPVVSLLGVVGNALNVAVFFRQGLRERVNVCLFSLALADLVVSLLLLPFLRERRGVAVLGPRQHAAVSLLRPVLLRHHLFRRWVGGGEGVGRRGGCGVCVCVCVGVVLP